MIDREEHRVLTDKNLVLERPHPVEAVGGVQRIYRFDSGYGLSLVNGSMLHAYPFAWEAAVLADVSEDGDSYCLTYATSLTDGVEVFETDEEANEFIARAARELGGDDA